MLRAGNMNLVSSVPRGLDGGLLLQVVRECIEYCNFPSRSVWLLSRLTARSLLFWLLAGVALQLAASMLAPAPLDQATFVLVIFSIFSV